VDGAGSLHRRLGLRRGDIVTVAPPGEFGKPRPALILQADLALPAATITYLPITTDLERVPLVRVEIEPTPGNGLRGPSEIMVDMMQTSTRSRFGNVIGHIDKDTLQAVERAVTVFLGLA
jgi:mRNA interferase MazF